MSEVIFRPASSAGYLELKSLLEQLGYELTVRNIADNIREIRARGGEVFVAVVNGRITGCVAAIIDVRLAEGIVGEIVSLVVAESARGQGIGKGLVNHAEQWLAQSVSTVRVRANVVREAAHKFYESGGYQLVKTQKLFKKTL